MTAPTPIPCEGGCGRLLRTPDSIRRRHGPVCWEKANPTRGRGHSRIRARRPKPVTPATGQLTLFEETTTMHASTTPSGRRYHHNSDYSGPIYINLAAAEFTLIEGGKATAILPLDDLRAIVAAADKAEAPKCKECEEPIKWVRHLAKWVHANDLYSGHYAQGPSGPPLHPAVPPTGDQA